MGKHTSKRVCGLVVLVVSGCLFLAGHSAFADSGKKSHKKNKPTSVVGLIHTEWNDEGEPTKVSIEGWVNGELRTLEIAGEERMQELAPLAGERVELMARLARGSNGKKLDVTGAWRVRTGYLTVVYDEDEFEEDETPIGGWLAVAEGGEDAETRYTIPAKGAVNKLLSAYDGRTVEVVSRLGEDEETITPQQCRVVLQGKIERRLITDDDWDDDSADEDQDSEDHEDSDEDPNDGDAYRSRAQDEEFDAPQDGEGDEDELDAEPEYDLVFATLDGEEFPLDFTAEEELELTKLVGRTVEVVGEFTQHQGFEALSIRRHTPIFCGELKVERGPEGAPTRMVLLGVHVPGEAKPVAVQLDLESPTAKALTRFDGKQQVTVNGVLRKDGTKHRLTIRFFRI